MGRLLITLELMKDMRSIDNKSIFRGVLDGRESRYSSFASYYSIVRR